MTHDHEPIESERVGMRLNFPPVPLRGADSDSQASRRTEVVQYVATVEEISPLRAFWDKHGIRYQPAMSSGNPAN